MRLPGGTVDSYVPGGRSNGIGGQRGANYWESKDRSDRRILVTSAGFLTAIDVRTGSTINSFAEGGKLDLRTGIDRALVPLASRTPGRITPRPLLRGPGIANYNRSLLKSTLITERFNAEFRTEVYNLFNRVQFGP